MILDLLLKTRLILFVYGLLRGIKLVLSIEEVAERYRNQIDSFTHLIDREAWNDFIHLLTPHERVEINFLLISIH
jgi:hypothetical protein